MSIANYVKQFLRESNKIVVQPVVVTTDTNPELEDELEYEGEDQDSLDEAIPQTPDYAPHIGGVMASKEFSDEISRVKQSHSKRQSQINTQNSEQNSGKSITQDMEKAGNVTDYNGYRNTETTSQAQRQADLNKLSTNQYANAKDITTDLKSSDSLKNSKDGKSETSRLKKRRQDQLKVQKEEQLGSDEMSSQRKYHGVDKNESMDFIRKFTFNEARPQAGSSKNPNVDPSIGSEVKGSMDEPEKMMNKRLTTQELQKKAQLQGKKLTTDVQNTDSLGVFIKNGEDADKLTASRVSNLDKFNKDQHSGEKSITQDLDSSNSFAALRAADAAAKANHSRRSGELAGLQASQQAEAYKGDEQKSLDVFKGVTNPNLGKTDPITGTKEKPKDNPKMKIEKKKSDKKKYYDDSDDSEEMDDEKMKDEAVWNGGNTNGMDGIDSRDDISMPNGKRRPGTKKTTTSKQSSDNTPVPKEACKKNKNKMMKDSQLVTQLDKTSIEAGKSNEKSHKQTMKDSVQSRAHTLVDSISVKSQGLPSDDVLIAMKELLTKNDVELEESIHREMVLAGYVNAFNEITETSKSILKTKEARKRLAELNI